MKERRFSKMQNWHYFMKTRENAKRIGKRIGSDSTSHFKAPESHGNDSETKKLSAVRFEAER